mmetsp:Transcript_30/g.64  ORF Transcript_30/g.64 Transcript_30/m.64 type:complete len:95 (-) Transcript_30:615-899(-)
MLREEESFYRGKSDWGDTMSSGKNVDYGGGEGSGKSDGFARGDEWILATYDVQRRNFSFRDKCLFSSPFIFIVEQRVFTSAVDSSNISLTSLIV